MIERIYVAAPYSSQNFAHVLDEWHLSELTNDLIASFQTTIHDVTREVQDHVDKAIEAGNAIHDKGHYAFVPHLTHYLHIHYSCKVDRGVWYYDYDNTFLDHWATSFLYLASSYGADLELDRAKKLGLKIYYNLDEIPRV